MSGRRLRCCAIQIASSTLGYVMLTTSTPVLIVVGRMDEGVSHLILLSVPLFVFLGQLIEMTGMARAMVGPQRTPGASSVAQDRLNGVDCTVFCHLPFKEPAMAFSASDVVPFTQARANLSELADQAKAGAEKIITKNGESYVALIDANRLDYYHRLERERIHLLLIDDAKRGLADIEAGRTYEADRAIDQLQRRRKAAAKVSSTAQVAKKRG